MKNFVIIPSLYAHIMSGFLLLLAVITLYNNFSKIRRIEPYKQIIIILIFSLAIGVHGLSHAGKNICLQ